MGKKAKKEGEEYTINMQQTDCPSIKKDFHEKEGELKMMGRGNK